MQFSTVNCFHGLSSWPSARSSTLLMLADVRRTCNVSLHEWPLICYQSNGLILLDMSFFYLKVSFHQYSIVCGSGSANWRIRSLHISVTNTEIRRQHDATSSNKYLTFTLTLYLFPSKHSLIILWKSEHFLWRYERKREWVFFSEHSVLESFM